MSINEILVGTDGPRMNINLTDGSVVTDTEIPTSGAVVALLSWQRVDGRLEVGGTSWKDGYSEGVTFLGETTFAIEPAKLETVEGRLEVARQVAAVAA
jgi:hypothetical protein